MRPIVAVDEHKAIRAVQALSRFSEKYDVVIEQCMVASFSIRICLGKEVEWTPCGKRFRRISLLERRPEESLTRPFVVEDYSGFSTSLTNELNEIVERFTGGGLWK